MITTLVHQNFSIGDLYTAQQIRDTLNNLYERCLVDRAAKYTDIMTWFTVRRDVVDMQIYYCLVSVAK